MLSKLTLALAIMTTASAAFAAPTLLTCEYRKQGRKASTLEMPLAGEYVTLDTERRPGVEGIVSTLIDGTVQIVVLIGKHEQELSMLRYDLSIPVRNTTQDLKIRIARGKRGEKPLGQLTHRQGQIPEFLFPAELAKELGLQCRLR